MATIDLSNYDSLLVQSYTGARASADGNIFFDVTNGWIELITVEEKATIDMTSRGGGTADANPLSNQDGIKMEALYAFEREQRRLDETLRRFDYFFEGTFKFGGAYKIVNGRVFDDFNGTDTPSTTGTHGGTDDRVKIRGSGWNEETTSGISRIYYGVVSLGTIETGSSPYYQLSTGATGINFAKDGPIDESIQVYGSTAYGDTGTTDFDTRTYLSNRIRTFGYNYDEKILLDSGVTEMGGYSSGFALGETVHLTSGSYSLADVYGGAQTGPWDQMSLENLVSPLTVTGFNEGTGTFSWVLNNTGSGDLNQCVAFLDALAQTDDDIDAGTGTVYGKRVGTWYSYDPQGRILTRSGADTDGLYIYSVPVADQQSIVFTSDTGSTYTYPFYSGIEVTVGTNAVADTGAWYHAFFLDGPGAGDFNSTGAITVRDSSVVEVKGNVSTDYVDTDEINFTFDYDGDTYGGTAGTNKDVVFECEGDGGVTAAKTVFTIIRSATIAVTCQPSVETNV
jgi:hypothetical protein